MPDRNIATTITNGHRLFAPSFRNDIQSSICVTGLSAARASRCVGRWCRPAALLSRDLPHSFALLLLSCVMSPLECAELLPDETEMCVARL